ncbi:MAG: multiphosphoryl transfer protein [Frankiales bacterium]|jgi:phosphocarrier protein FPr|nr:multiphosphoryl transfer protein [Frankiales bacterium]
MAEPQGDRAGSGGRASVGLVVVSHSRALASAAVALAAEMLHGREVRIEVAAGLDDRTFGTDAVQIREAIERVDGPGGVVVLMDLGSAVLSAELALDLLDDPTARDRVILSPAPIVEGLVVASVAAAGGAGRAEVAAEARNSLMGKAAHLGGPDHLTVPEAESPAQDEVVAVFTIGNRHGLHARPAARLVAEVRGLDATVRLSNLTTGAGPVPAGSLSRVATLGALRGHDVEVRASGRQAQDAVEHLLALAARDFDEVGDGVAATPVQPSRPGPLPGSPGIGIGPARHLTAEPVEPADDAPIAEPAAEWRRIVGSVAEVRREIEHVRVLTAREAGAGAAGIFDAHLSLLSDAELLGDVKRRISAGEGATGAWVASLAAVEQEWAALPDPYLRERAQDVRAVRDQVVRVLTGSTVRRPAGDGVLVAADLTPAEAAELDPERVSGVVLTQGSASSHAAILARARNIPLVVAAGGQVLAVPEGTMLVLDGGTGELQVDPPAEVLAAFRVRGAEMAERRARELALAGQPAVSMDGTSFAVSANLGSVADAWAAVAAGAEGAGLVRTEFLFLGRSSAPDLAEQQAEYDAIGAAMDGRRVTLRTLDVGGDKPLTYLPMPAEANPFLGVRGLRLSLATPDLLRDQLTAICRSARRWPTSVMFPMVTSLDELLEARRVLTEAAGPDGVPYDLRVGIMVEVPAAALKIESFLPHVDFVSIGTNDLTQYAVAAERGNPSVAALSDALDPAVLQLVAGVCSAALGRASVSVCGEAAADELAIPLLVGLGVRELSVTPAAVPRVKARLRALDVEQCRAAAEEALSLPGPDEVRKLAMSL